MSSAEQTFYEFATSGLRWAWLIVGALFVVTSVYLVLLAGEEYSLGEWGPFFIIGAAILTITSAEFWISASWVLLAIEVIMIVVVLGVWLTMVGAVRGPNRRPPTLVLLLFLWRWW